MTDPALQAIGRTKKYIFQHCDKYLNAARQVRSLNDEIFAIFNPIDNQEAARRVCVDNKAAHILRDEFIQQEFGYYTVYPEEDKLPRSMRTIVEAELGHSPSTTLKVATCGEPLYGPWAYLEDVQWSNELRSYPSREKDITSVLIGVGYPLAPSRVTKEQQVACTRQCLQWCWHNLTGVLKSMGINADIKWDYVSISGVSFGSYMAILAYSLSNSPDFNEGREGFRVRNVILNDLVVDEQRREPNDYVGLPISRKKATKDAQDVLERLERMPFEIPRSGSKPPTFMYGAPVFPISHQFPNLMVLTQAVQILKDASAHLDRSTRFWIRQATEDRFVNPKVMEAFAMEMREIYDMEVHFQFEKGRMHVESYNAPLSPEYIFFVEASFLG
ncbi:hypothetical protein CC86DRAFT_414258 [Ophiobolus disseminans]|uniref:Alpha/beta-hydrolase n=1 Tax=Ophiobolus disseminans TaxID=1469910 RepID=A0A6A6ZBH1_9PLEO|nr:hypothetical protein CC86DRAFT_414258 [Ophiobolus disseminans]